MKEHKIDYNQKEFYLLSFSMKRTFFIIVVFVSIILIILSLLSWSKPWKYDGFSFLNSDITLDKEADIFYKALSFTWIPQWDFNHWSIDGFYYQSESKEEPFKIKKTDNNIQIVLGKGVFLFSLNDIFYNYTVSSGDYKILPIWKWIFLINNLSWAPIFYSYNSILDVNFLDKSQKPKENFKIFPSFYFKYNTYDSKVSSFSWGILVESDLKNFYYLDYKDKDFINKIFWGGNLQKKFLEVSLKRINEEINKNNKAYRDFLINDFNNPITNDLLTKYPNLFFNETKKGAFYKNELTKNIFLLLNAIEKNNQDDYDKYKDLIKKNFNDMKFSPEVLASGQEIIKKYYYFYNYWNIYTDWTNIIKKDKLSYVNVIKEIFDPKQYREDYFSTLSNLYMSYDFNFIDHDLLERYLNEYFSYLVENKINEKDYPNFIYFASKYLAANLWFTENSYNIFSNLTKLNNKYINSWAKGDNKIEKISLAFTNYSEILRGFYANIINTYFIYRWEDIILLKSNYVSWGSVNLPNNILNSLNALDSLIWDELNLSKKWIDIKQIDSTTLEELQKLYEKIDKIYEIVVSYWEYTKDINLNDITRSTTWIKLNSSQEKLSRENLTEYLSQFNGLDLNTLRILNDFSKDWYYKVMIDIKSSASIFEFSFDLYPDWHYVNNLIRKDKNAKAVEGNKNKDQFKELSISLDKKQEYMKKKAEWNVKPEDKYKTDFKNIFELIYIFGSSPSQSNIVPINNTSDNEYNNMSVEMKAFIQKNLIDWDFKNINETFPIWFNNIKAEVQDNYGWYKIEIFGIKKSFKIKDTDKTYNLNIGSKYVFTKKHFFNTNFIATIKKWEKEETAFSGKVIYFLPERIEVLLLEKYFKDLSYYIVTLDKNYNWQNEIKIDLENKIIILDWKKYPVSFADKKN